jgi:class 3 adenylate cyclase
LTRDSDTVAGIEAYKQHDWTKAYELLSPLLESDLEEPEAVEALGSAAWWIGDIETTINARQRAYAEYVAQGRNIDASRVAIQVAEDHYFLLQSSTANGWLNKAHRVLDDVPVAAEHGHLMRLEAVLASNLEKAVELSARVHQVGVDLGDVDLEMVGLHDGGRFLVASGEVDSGMAMMEEAMISAVAGELSPRVTGRIFCNMIEACASMADYRRAIEWSDQTMRWCEGIGNAGGYPGVCRVRRAEFMRLRGAWSDAEEEAKRAIGDLAGLRPYMGEGFDQLGMVRLNLGDIAGAEKAFRRAHSLGSNSMLGLALVKLAQDDPAEGLSLIQAGLASAEGLTVRMQLLPVAVEIALASSDLEAAEKHASELESLVERYDSEVLRAFSLHSTARVAVAKNAPDAAPLLREAVNILLASGLPFEAARARLDLGTALTQTGSEGLGRLEIDAAKSEFERLGAQWDLDRLSEILLTPTVSERPRQMTTMMFTDIVGSTELVGVIGDESWADLISWHDRTIRTLIGEYAGTEIDHAGDGFFVSFASPEEALGCAAQIQRVFERHRKEEGFSPRVRIGVHAGRVLLANEGLVGHQVHVAARVASEGESDEVLVTLETINHKTGFVFENERTITAKGVEDPLAVSSLVWKD